MAVDPKLVARLRALQRGCAQRCATHLRVIIQPHALVLCPIALAGDDTTIHAIAFGKVGERAEVLSVPDPRRRDDQYRLFRSLGEEIECYFQWCREHSTYPQIWVSSAAGAVLLDTVAERSRYAQSDGEDEEVEKVRRFGTLLSFATDRYPLAGQQALLTATGVLSDHFATGQDEGADEHLGADLCWMEPPAGTNILAAVAAAEQIPMGAKTDPEFDRDLLAPLLSRYNKARREGAHDSVLDVLANEIRRALVPVVERIYAATQRAIEFLLEASMPWLPALENIEQSEASEFSHFMRARDLGFPLSRRDGPKAAAFKLSAREDAQQNYEAAVMIGDGISRAQGRLNGRIVLGTVENPQRIRVAPRRFRYTFDLVSEQQILRVRRGDGLHLLDGRTFVAVVSSVSREGDSTRISVELVKGMKAVGLPLAGETLELTSKLPDWSRLWRERRHLRTRLAQTPWTHSNGSATVAQLRIAPADPLAAVEGLR